MEIKAELIKPYTEKQRINFIVEYNHKQGYTIEETETSLQALGYNKEEIEQKEHERLDMLFLTGADVERGVYQAKGMDFDDIMAFVMANPPEGLDVKALKIELKANNFYRGNPYVNTVGALLGFTSEQLDKFFETKDYKYLTTCTLTVNVTPETVTVTGAGTYPYGSTVDVIVECEGYVTYTETLTLTENVTLDIELETANGTEQASDISSNNPIVSDEVIDDNTISTDKSDIQDELDTMIGKSNEIGTDNV